MTLNDLKFPKEFGEFFSFLLQRTFQEWIATKWLEIDQDNLRTGSAKAVAHLMSFAQITNLLHISLFFVLTFLKWNTCCFSEDVYTHFSLHCFLILLLCSVMSDAKDCESILYGLLLNNKK